MESLTLNLIEDTPRDLNDALSSEVKFQTL